MSHDDEVQLQWGIISAQLEDEVCSCELLAKGGTIKCRKWEVV